MRVLYGSQLVELQGGSTIAVAAVSKDLNDELLLVVFSDSQRIGADRIVDQGAKVMDVCSLLPRPTGGVNNSYE